MTADVKWLFEISWEVCNKVGGIYTVLKSKAREAVREFGDEHYLSIGPLLVSNPEFQPEEDPFFSEVIESLQEKNISAAFGRWNIEGRPRCLLIGFQNAFPQRDKLLFELWEDYGVDSMFGSFEYVEPVLFSTACGMAIKEIFNRLADADAYAHFHEWMAGAGMLYVKKHVPEISTVFTTHATILGRAISGTGADIHANLSEIDPPSEAKRHNLSAKFSMESVCAREADCFTAVSKITGQECKALLGTEPDIITPNGFNLEDVPDFSKDIKQFENARTDLLEFASGFLNEKLDPSSTKIISISGRYEFHNKGIDVLIESLSRLNKELKTRNSSQRVVCLFLVIGANVGVHSETRLRLRHALSVMERFSGISTHHLGDAQNDPILTGCSRVGLMNAPEDKCNVIFVPVYLDGNDGVINRPYYDVLAGCDAGVYPSNYEPWGYTPLESVAYSVPAVTTDKAGFGIWVKENIGNDHPGIKVLERLGKEDHYLEEQLFTILDEWVCLKPAQEQEHKKGARKIAEQATWRNFYQHYREAYGKAVFVKNIRIAGVQEEVKHVTKVFTGTNSIQPRLRPFSVVSSLPERIGKLRDIAYNLWWVWNRSAQELFSRLDPALWEELCHNPVAMLEQVDLHKLEEMAADKEYTILYDSILKAYEEYINNNTLLIQTMKNISPKHPVAYFTMECGIHESIPTYSGGLGILSGDHLKSASDLNIPLVGVTLLYKYGYFRQRITGNNEQVAEYMKNDFAGMPIDVARNKDGARLVVNVDFPGRTVKVQVWKAQVGRTVLYFLDTDFEDNAVRDREITDRLYDAETRERIEQEIILGVGGVRLFHELNIEPAVFHLNEGHSAFLILERIAGFMRKKKIDFDAARELVKSSTVFTTHTPVPAGNERFDKALIENHFQAYVYQTGISWEQFWNLGHIFAGDESPFDMTVCALKGSFKNNAVSRLHGSVSRKMWQKLWNGFLVEEIPICHVTNGVHLPSWMADEIRQVVEKYGNFILGQNDTDVAMWDGIDSIPDAALWREHKTLKDRLFDRIGVSIQHNWTREGEDPTLWERFRARLDPSVLTIGFARRFARYKRPLLIFKNIEKLKQLISNETNPIQFVFAGKAHPADRAGADMIREIVRLSKDEEFLGRLIFLENYNIDIARLLVSGVDVWLNNPVRYQEASGTSGMKASINGVVNCSIPDGWWDEAYTGENGFVIGRGSVYENSETQDLVDSENLYSLLKERIVPLYYKRDDRQISSGWVRMMKNSIKSVGPVFNTHRMVTEYISEIYEPTAERHVDLVADDCRKAMAIAEWKRKLASRFATLHIRSIQVDGIHGDITNLGDKVSLRVTIDKGDLAPEEILPELIVQDTKASGSRPFHFIGEMKLINKDKGVLTYEGVFHPDRNGKFKYGVRMIPYHEYLGTKYETGLVVWS